MPTIAETLVGTVAQSAQEGPRLEEIAGIAQNISNVRAQREQIELKKQELQMQKAVAVTDTLKIAAQSKDKNLKNFLLKKVMPSKIKALGMEKFFTPETMEMIQTSDEIQRKVLGLQLHLDEQVRSGVMTGAQAYQIAQQKLSDPEELALLDTDQLFEAQKFKHSEEGKSARAEKMAEGVAGRQQKEREAAGSVELSKQTARKYAEYVGAGGRAGMESSLARLKEAAEALETGQVKTGGLSTKIPGFRSDAVQSELNPKLVEVRTQAQAALNTVLRATLGAQFTEQEGIRILNQVWDDKLSPSANAKKIRAEVKKLTKNVADQEELFRKQGFLENGASGAQPNTDWKADLASKKDRIMKFRTQNPTEYEKVIKMFADKYKITVEEVLKALGIN